MSRKIEARNDRLEESRINESMARAHQEYGRHFEEAYTVFTQMDQVSRLRAREVRHQFTRLGEALMQTHDIDLVASLGTGRNAPPFMGGVPTRMVRVMSIRRIGRRAAAMAMPEPKRTFSSPFTPPTLIGRASRMGSGDAPKPE